MQLVGLPITGGQYRLTRSVSRSNVSPVLTAVFLVALVAASNIASTDVGLLIPEYERLSLCSAVSKFNEEAAVQNEMQ